MDGLFVGRMGRILCESPEFGVGSSGGLALAEFNHFRCPFSVCSGRFACSFSKRKTRLGTIGLLFARCDRDDNQFLDRTTRLAASFVCANSLDRFLPFHLEYARHLPESRGVDVDCSLYLCGASLFASDNYAGAFSEHSSRLSDGQCFASDAFENSCSFWNCRMASDDCYGAFAETIADVSAFAQLLDETGGGCFLSNQCRSAGLVVSRLS